MKKQILAAVFLLALGFAPRIHALPTQDQVQLPTGTTFPSPDEVVKILDSKLSLSDDQKSKITPIIVDRQQKMKAILADTSSRPMQQRRKAKQILSDSDKKINAILTSDQQQKYAQAEQQIQEQMKQRMQQGKKGTSN
jgi:protein CpxP